MVVLIQTVTSLFPRQQDRGSTGPAEWHTTKALPIEGASAVLGNDFLASRPAIHFSCQIGVDAIGP
ncbi:MAG: hypothetical protein RLZZ356_102 [Verrucomicrobiota bacterium]|jgi:hypothetical protein